MFTVYHQPLYDKWMCKLWRARKGWNWWSLALAMSIQTKSSQVQEFQFVSGRLILSAEPIHNASWGPVRYFIWAHGNVHQCCAENWSVVINLGSHRKWIVNGGDRIVFQLLVARTPDISFGGCFQTCRTQNLITALIYQCRNLGIVRACAMHMPAFSFIVFIFIVLLWSDGLTCALNCWNSTIRPAKFWQCFSLLTEK